MKAKGLLAVEMEAAALYSFAKARGKPVICFAHVTNQMARIEGDFEKGEADGSVDALAVIVGCGTCLVAEIVGQVRFCRHLAGQVWVTNGTPTH